MDRERPIIATLLGVESGMYETNDSYCEAIEEAGGMPVQLEFVEVYKRLKELKPDGILLPGGAFKTPDCWYGIEGGDDEFNPRTRAYIDMLDYAEEYELPTLAICAGIQLLAVRCGALLIPKIEGHKVAGDAAHTIRIAENSRLAKIIGQREIVVNSRHNEAINPNSLDDDLIATAVADDGTIEAVELKNGWNDFVIGIQFHPENLANHGDETIKRLFRSFIEAVKN